MIAREYGFPSWARLKAYVAALRSDNSKPTQRREYIRVLATELLELGRTGALEMFAQRLTLPLRDILELRAWLVNTGLQGALVDALLKGLESPKDRVRYLCANALDHLADARCAPALERLLSDPVPRVRRAALHALGCDACKLEPLPGRQDLVPKLTEIAQSDSNARVRGAALEVLAVNCDPRANDAVRALLETERNAGRKRFLRRLVT